MSHGLRISLVALLLAGAGALLSPRRILREAWRRLYLAIAVVGLIAIVVHEKSGTGQAILSLVVVCDLFSSRRGGLSGSLQGLRVQYRFFLCALSVKDRLAHTAVLFCRAIDTSEIIKKTAYPNDARPVTEGADALDRLECDSAAERVSAGGEAVFLGGGRGRAAPVSTYG